MKRISKLLSLMMVLALAAGTATGVRADDVQTVSEIGSETAIPITLSADPTRFSVTLPTAFPMVIDPETGESATPDNLKIVNASSGSIRVSELRVEKAGDWSLADFGADLRNADVDSNQLGVSIFPTGGRNAGEGGTVLATVGGSPDSQTLLSGGDNGSEWIIDAANDGASDELGLIYSSVATPVSAQIYSAQVASIIITITWNK